MLWGLPAQSWEEAAPGWARLSQAGGAAQPASRLANTSQAWRGLSKNYTGDIATHQLAAPSTTTTHVASLYHKQTHHNTSDHLASSNISWLPHNVRN